MLTLIVLVCIAGNLQADFQGDEKCIEEYRNGGISINFPDNVAHAIHAPIDAGLPYFNPRMSKNDALAYFVSGGISASNNDFASEPMRFLDKLMHLPHKYHKGEGVIFSVVHDYHTVDILERIREEYNASVRFSPPSRELCACLLNTGENGINERLTKLTREFRRGTGSSWSGEKLPRLTSPEAWLVWRKVLLYFYSKPALQDAAMFLHCATPDL